MNTFLGWSPGAKNWETSLPRSGRVVNFGGDPVDNCLVGVVSPVMVMFVSPNNCEGEVK